MKGSRLASILILLCAGSVGGCEHRHSKPSSLPHPHYTLGRPWQSDGYWFYPSDELMYGATGLAVVDAPRRDGTLTADGERYDPALLAGAHQSLQLPVVLHVRNLENGLEIVLRVNDRGPSSPARLLSVTPRAARLLQMVPGHATRVQLTEDELLSRRYWSHLEGAPAPDVIAAPVGAVQEQSLMGDNLPGRVDQAGAGNRSILATTAPEQAAATVKAGFPDPGALWIDAGRFSQPGYARQLAARLAGTVRQDGQGRSASFKVRIGPFELTAEADAALDRARSAGVTGARIIVE